MMKLEHMRLFMNVVESGSISQTADNAFISQQGLSTALKQMEKELEIDLFYRSNKGVTVTEAGMQFYHCCESMMQLYDDFLDQAQNSDVNDTFNLYIAINMRNLLPLINEAPFAKKHDWFFNYLERPAEDAVATINEREGIAIFSVFDEEEQKLLERVSRSLPIYNIGSADTFVSVCHKDHPILQRPKSEWESFISEMKCVISSSPEYDIKHAPGKTRRTICLPDLYSCKEFLKTQDAHALLTWSTYRMHFDPREYVILSERKAKKNIQYYAVFHLKKTKVNHLLEQELTSYLREVLAT